MAKKAPTPQPQSPALTGLQAFDAAPDSALVNGKVVSLLYGNASRATLFRMEADGRLPKSIKLTATGPRLWRAGDLRAALASLAA